MFRKQHIANWGNHPSIKATVTQLEYVDELVEYVYQEASLLARGNGRCYGDAALHERIFSTLRLNKFIDFDKQFGELECQAGVMLSDILELIVPKGFFLPVTPGTKFITVGGAIAADVHGKNHHVEGCFSRHLLHFDLMRGDGKIYRCTPTENTTLFWETIGGMGLTGIILSARFRLLPITTTYLRQERIKAKDLPSVMELFEASKDWTYSVAWIDCLASGRAAGRSILMRAEHAKVEELKGRMKSTPLHIRQRHKLSIPFYLPSWLLNRYSIGAFNSLFYQLQSAQQDTSIIDYDRFFYPLDSIHHWNRIYGRKGFTQYQLVFPLTHSERGLIEVLALIQKERRYPFLTVLKLFGAQEPKAFNSFPIEGYTLAMDFKIDQGIRTFIAKLDEIVLRYEGKVYLAKDAFSDRQLSGLQFEHADAKFQSLQQQRLQ